MKKTCFSILLATVALCLSSSGLQAQSATYLVVSIVATAPEASETGPSPGAFTISYVGTNAWPSTSVLRVFYRISGTAQNGMDYVAISNWVAIPSGTNAISIPIVPIDDKVAEGIENVRLDLVPTPLDSGPPYRISSRSNAVVTILDNDVPPTNLPPDSRIVAPANGASFTAPANIMIFANPQDVDGTVQAVEFFANRTSLGVVTNNPLVMSPINPWQVAWSNVPPGSYALTAVATDDDGASAVSPPVTISVLSNSPPRQAVVTIVATDPYATEIPVVPPGMEMPQRYDPAVFTVTRKGDTNSSLTVFYTVGGSAQNGVDYTSLPGTVTIPAGAVSAEIIVDPIDDPMPEGTESVAIRIEPPICPAVYPPPPDCYLVGVSNLAVAFIQDNDTVTNPTPVVTIAATDARASETGLDTATFTVTRTGDTAQPLNVYYITAGTAQNGLDYERLSNYVVIPAGAAAADIVVTPIDDNLVEGPETVVVQLRQPVLPLADDAGSSLPVIRTNVVVLPPPYAVGTPGSALASIVDNDTVGTNIPPRVTMVRPMSGLVFKAPANIGLVADARDLDGSIASVEFFAGNTSLGFATITPLNSTPAQYFLLWSNVPAGSYVLTAKAIDNQEAIGISQPVRISVIETNPPPQATNTMVSIRAIDPIACEGRFDFPTTVIVQSNVLSAGIAACYCPTSSVVRWTNIYCGTNTATFEVRRSGSTNADLTVYYVIEGTASNGVDYVAIDGSVTIAAGRRAAQIVIVPIDDRLAEGMETVVLRLVLPAGTSSATILPPYQVGTPSRAAAVIYDNEYPVRAAIRLPDGLFHVQFPAAPGSGLRLESSTDLVNWSPCFSTIATGTAVDYVDPDASAGTIQFYRTVPEPVMMPEE